jgi:hypothetical protein
MWGWDGLISVLLGIAAWRMAYLGVHVTIHPSGTRKGRTKKSVKVEFYAIAVASTILIVTQAYRTNKAYSGLLAAIRRNQSPSVVLGNMRLNQPIQPLIPNQDFVVGMAFLVTDGTAQALHCNIYAFGLPGEESPEQNRAAIKKFKLRIVEDGEAPGTNMSKGQGCYKGVNLRFSSEEISELIAAEKAPARRIIYIAGHAGWKNDAGADFQKDECRWMEPPKSNVVINPGWHECGP